MNFLKLILIIFVVSFVILFIFPYFFTINPSQPSSSSSTAEKQVAEEKQAIEKQPLKNLGLPTGTVAPKIQFVLSKSNFTSTVGDRFTYSFCQPTLNSSSDLCTASAANPTYGLPPYSFYLQSGVGFLPYGLTLNLNGLLEGTPTAKGSRTVGICAKDTGGVSVCHQIVINIQAKAVNIGPYDGHYTVNVVTQRVASPTGCGGSWYNSSGTSYFAVKNNIVIDSTGHTATVSASGDAEIKYTDSPSRSNGNRDETVTVLHFSADGTNINLAGTQNSKETWDDEGRLCSETVQFTYSGVKN